MDIIPLQAVPNQVVLVSLDEQATQINVYQKATGLFMDVYLRGVLLLSGVRCLNKVFIVRDAYFGFSGDLAFVDQQGTDDPDYTGIGSRFLLYYYEPSDL